MKTNTYILIALFAVFLTACNEEKYLRVPAVETLSVQMWDNNVIISGKVTDSGNVGVSAGVYFTQGHKPKSATENQILLDVANDGSFQAVISELKEDSTYYFGTFVLSSIGFGLGEIIAFKVPRFAAPVSPCENTLTTNHVKDGNQIFSVSASTEISPLETYDFILNKGSFPEITFSFKDKPITGIYETVSQVDRLGSNSQISVKISKNIGYTYYASTVSHGQLVYVNCVEENNFIISFCDLSYAMNYENYSLTGRFEIEAR